MTRSLPLTLALLLALASPLRSDPPEAPPCEWTILMYAMADCDLEGFMVDDLIEAVQAKPSDRIRVVVQIDRAEESEPERSYSGRPVGGLPAWTSTKRLLVEGGGKVVELADLGEADMGNPKTLADFVAWGFREYPSERTMLVLGDHGMGWPGFGGDESHEDKGFTLAEIAEGLTAGMNQAGVQRLDLLGFDCCLMAGLDVLHALRSFARWMIASAELEPGYGWHYEAFLTALADRPEMDGAELGKVVCDSYQDFFRKHRDVDVREEGADVTLALFDLERVPDLVSATEALAERMTGLMEAKGRPAWLAVAKAFRKAGEYDPGDEPSFFYDLENVAAGLKGRGADAECAALRKALRAAILHKVAGPGHAGGCGLSVYFPQEQQDYEASYPESAFSPAWVALISEHLGIEIEDSSAPGISDVAAEDIDLAEGEATSVTGKLSGEDVAEVCFVLAVERENEEVIIGRYPVAPEGTDLEEPFDGTWPAIGDARNQVLAPVTSFELTDEKEEIWRLQIPALYRDLKGKDWIRVDLHFLVDWNGGEFSGQFVYAFEDTEHGPAPVDIATGGKIKPVYLVVNDQGEEEERPAEDGATLTVGEDGLDLVEEELEPGSYLVGFTVEDYAGNVAEELVEVEVR